MEMRGVRNYYWIIGLLLLETIELGHEHYIEFDFDIVNLMPSMG